MNIVLFLQQSALIWRQPMMKFSLDIDYILKWPKFLLQIFGLWNDNSSKICLFLLRSMLFFLVISTILSSFNEIFTTDHQLLMPANFVAQTIRYLSWLQKIFIYLTKRKKMSDLLASSFCNITAPTFLRSYTKQFRLHSNKIMNKSYIMRYVYIILFILIIIFLEHFDLSSLAMIVIFIISRLLFALLHIQALGYSIMYLSWLELSLCQLEHMNQVLRTLQYSRRNVLKKQKLQNSRNQIRITETLRYVIQLHQRVARFINGLNHIFSFVMLMELWSTHVIFSVTFVKLVFEGLLHDMALTIAIVISTILIYFYMGLICWKATCIVEQSSSKLQNNLCNVPWWEWNSSNLNLRNCMFSISMREMQIRAGPIYNFSLPTFATILSVSLYYFIFLYQLGDGFK
ncbi:Odorant receptor 4 [Ephemera danica]|nr:Odorant receptor 4 [Ephemera danica]